MSVCGGMSNDSVDIDLKAILSKEPEMSVYYEAKRMYDLQNGCEMKFSKQCVEVACDVVYTIVAKKRLAKIHEILNNRKNNDYDGDDKFPELLALPTNDGKHEGIPMIVTLDNETTFEMLRQSTDIIVSPLIRELKLIGESISIKYHFIEEDKQVIIGILWEKENK